MNFFGVKSTLWVVALGVFFVSCQSTKGAQMKTISTDLPEERRTIIYAENGVVSKKICDLPVTLPIQRNCQSAYEVSTISLESFLGRINLDFGDFNLSARGLSEVDVSIQMAHEQVTQGNVKAIEVLQNLRSIKANLKRILEIREGLLVSDKTYTLTSSPSNFALMSKAFENQTTVEIITSERASDN